ncbi:MAG: DUF1858 domain-containing protein [Nitrospinales bacterium]
MVIRSDTTINDILHKYPETLKFFNDLNMSCSGCFAVNFDTLENGALMHGMDVNLLVSKLKQFIRNLPSDAPPEVISLSNKP